jgi:hypothetical protein
MTTPHEQMREAFNQLKLNEKRRTFAECEYWLNQYKQFCEQALAATPEPVPIVCLSPLERSRIAMSCQSTQQVISATIDAMIAKNGGEN